MQTQQILFEDIIDESIELQPMHPGLFDEHLAEGWRLLGYSIIRHNYAACRGRLCYTIPLRIRLDGLIFSKSQRSVLRRNNDLTVKWGKVQLTPEKEELFKLHTSRFRERQPESVYSFLSPQAGSKPVRGMEMTLYEGERLLACSYVHLGEEAMSGTYCFFEPEASRQRSLGTFTMLLELIKAREMGKRFYYHGYCYDVPSQFDYKMNFHNLESMDWKTGIWHPRPRVPVRRWENLVEQWPPPPSDQ